MAQSASIFPLLNGHCWPTSFFSECPEERAGFFWLFLPSLQLGGLKSVSEAQSVHAACHPREKTYRNSGSSTNCSSRLGRSTLEPFGLEKFGVEHQFHVGAA